MTQDLVTFDIKTEGKSIPDSFQVASIEVNLLQHQGAYAILQILAGKASGAGFPVLDSDSFKLDTSIEVKAGYSGKNSSIFSGKVVSQELSISQADGPLVIIVCEGATLDGKGDHALTLAYGDDILDLHMINEESGISGQVTFPGNALLPGSQIGLRNTGNLFSGNHNVNEVIHHIGEGDWITEAGLGLANVDEGTDEL